MKKFHLAGAFGQGGSTALAYSNYTLIVSRAADVSGDGPHPVAFTVVRFNELDPEEDKHGTYEYMVNRRTGQPFQIELNEQEFQHGTLVRHVAMDVGKFSTAMTSPTSGFYHLANRYLFDPLLPFLVRERRSGRKKDQRSVAGNNRRLGTSGIVEYSRSSIQNFKNGEVTINWWVISTKGGAKKPKNRIKNYTLASKPIVVTYNGQKQGEFSNSVIKKDLKLPYLERFIVVQVDCDSIDNKTRRELFPTTRENLRDATIQEELRELIVSTLQADDNLRRLDRKRKEEYLQRTDSESVDRIRERLASRIQDRIESDGSGSGSGSSGGSGGSGGGPEPEPIPVQKPPTFIEITSREPRTVHPGQRFTISFDTDAKPEYFRRDDSFMPIVDPVGIAEYTGTTSVRGGHGKAHFKVPDDATIGNEGQIALEVRPDGSPSLSDSIKVEVKQEEKGAGSGDGKAKVPNVEPQWVQKGDPFWEQEDWDETNVAEVLSDDESTVVYISADNENLDGLVKRAQRQGGSTVDAIKNFYMEHVAYHAVIAHLDLNEIEKDSDDLSSLESEQKREFKRLSQTICGIMEDMFDVISQKEAELESGSNSTGDESSSKKEAAEVT